MRRIITRNNFTPSTGYVGYFSDTKAVDIDTSVATAISDGTAKNVSSVAADSYLDEDIPNRVFSSPLTERPFDPIITHYNQKHVRANDSSSETQTSANVSTSQSAATIVENSNPKTE